METCDIVDVLARLRVSPDHRVDHDPAKVVVNADDHQKDNSTDPSVAAKEVENATGNKTREESEKLESHQRRNNDSFNYARTLSEAVFAAFKQMPDRALQPTPLNTPNQTAATPTKASALPMPPTGSPSRSIPEIVEAARARNAAAPLVRQIYDRAQAKSHRPTKKPVTVSEILDFKKSLSEKTGVIYVGEEALAETTLAPSKAYINEGKSQIRVFKNQSDVEREDELDKYKLEIEEDVKNDFKKLIASEKPLASDKPNCPLVESGLKPVPRASISAEGPRTDLAAVTNSDGADSSQELAQAQKSSAESKTVASESRSSNTPILKCGPFGTKPENKSEPVDFISDLKSLSKSRNFTSGKWLISVPWNEVDNAWNIIKTEFVNGRLTEETRFIKVYGRQDNEENPHFRRSTTGGRYSYNAMISIMTNDWTDEAKTMDVAKKIRAAGVKVVLRYKPDISTTLQIYSGNTMRAKPTVYTLE